MGSQSFDLLTESVYDPPPAMLIHERGLSKGPNATRKVLIGREFHVGKVEEVGLRPA